MGQDFVCGFLRRTFAHKTYYTHTHTTHILLIFFISRVRVCAIRFMSFFKKKKSILSEKNRMQDRLQVNKIVVLVQGHIRNKLKNAVHLNMSLNISLSESLSECFIIHTKCSDNGQPTTEFHITPI